MESKAVWGQSLRFLAALGSSMCASASSSCGSGASRIRAQQLWRSSIAAPGVQGLPWTSGIDPGRLGIGRWVDS